MSGSFPFGASGEGHSPFGTSLGAGGLSTLDQLLAYASNALSTPVSQLASGFTDFSTPTDGPDAQRSAPGWVFNANTGTITYPTTLGQGGIVQIATIALVSTSALISDTKTNLLQSVATNKGYVAFSGRWASAGVGGTPHASCMLINAARSASMGFTLLSAVDAANVLFQYDGLFAGTTVAAFALDALFHLCEIWWVGDGNVHFRIDRRAVQTVTPVTPLTGSLQVETGCFNSAAVTVRSISLDYYFQAAKRG